MFLLYLIVPQLCTSSAIDTTSADRMARSIFQLNNARALEDAGTSLEDNVLKILTGGQIQNASSYTSFLFYSRGSEGSGARVDLLDRSSILNAGFSISKNTKIVIHGWMQNGTGRFSTITTQAFLYAEDLNMISVDWSGYSQQLYSVAREAVPYVGAYTASLVDFLVQDVGVDISTIHVVGFSLGAHIAGVVGENAASGKLPRITGLDPAGPLYSNSTTKDRLDATDARFVDVIHTDAGMFGFADPCGTVDFYPNGGDAIQPGCLLNTSQPFCTHSRAFLLFAESISSEGFVSTKCNSYGNFKRGVCAGNETAIMGYNVNTGSRGVFYLRTNSKSPYAEQ